MSYIVKGGIYTDTTFTKLVPGTEEQYGPFATYPEAKDQWHRATFTQKLDIATHRVFIEEID